MHGETVKYTYLPTYLPTRRTYLWSGLEPRITSNSAILSVTVYFGSLYAIGWDI